MKQFKEFLKEGKVKQSDPDPSMAASLLEQARQRLKDVQRLEITDDTASFRFESAYEAAREATQSCMADKGLKPYSHEAIVAFALEQRILNEADTSTFDRFREIRNDINYRGAKTTIEEAKEAIQFAKKVLQNVLLLKNEV